MLKNYPLLCLVTAFLFQLSLTAQQPLAIDSMTVNTIKARMYSDGGFWEIQAEDSTNSYQTIIFAQNLWIGGMDANSNLKVSAQTYRQGRVNFYPGPISNDPNVYANYNQVHHVKLSTLSDFVRGNTSGIPAEIANWPAHGDTAMGEAANLAPFVDVNQDGVYNPAQGDYPKIKGDEALFAIFNDKNDAAPGEGLGLEFHVMIYGYNTGGQEDSVLYLEYKVFNRSSDSFSDMYLSSFTDLDLGNSADDLNGTNVNADAVIGYNADNLDEGPNGFGSRPAAASLRMLKGPPADYFDGIDNDKDGCVDGINVNGICQTEDPASGIREHYKSSGSMYFNRAGSGSPTVTNDPSTSAEFYSYMQSLWRGGYDLIMENPSGIGSTTNGDGFVASNVGLKSLYMYPGNSTDSTGTFGLSLPVNWFESPNNKGDKRSLISAGPFSLSAGQSFDLSMAIVWSRHGDNLAGYDLINSKVENLDELYGNQPVRNVGLRAYRAAAGYKLYYRPEATEWIIENQKDGDVSFKIFSASGQWLTTFKVEGRSSEIVPVAGLPKGVYLLVDGKAGSSFKILH